VAKRVSRQSLLKGNQRDVPLDGRGVRSAGKNRVRPNNNTEQTWSASSLKKGNQRATPLDGVRGPKRTG
jgi:hypothetical protein